MNRLARSLAAAVPAAAIAPFFALAAYAHPQNDDWGFASMVLKFGYGGANAVWYRNWTGRYLSTAWASATPLSMRTLTGFPVAVAANLALFVGGAVALALAILPREVPRRARAAVGLVLAALHLATMPSIAEGVYWFSGSSTYLLGSAFLAWVVALSAAVDRLEGGRRRAALAGAILAAALAAGTNEIAAACVVAAAAGRLAWASRAARRVRWDLLAVVAVAVAGAAVELLAPGNRARAATQAGAPVGAALAIGVAWAGRWALEWLQGPIVPAALATVAAVPWPEGGDDRGPRPAVVLALWAAAVAAACALPSLAGGGVPTRAANAVNWLFVVGALATAVSLRRPLAGLLGRLPGPRLAAPIALAALAIALAALRPTSLRLAVTDLASGEARRYDAEMRLRHASLRACPYDVCDVPPVEPALSLWWFEDALLEGYEPQFFHGYKDATFAYWFGKKRVRLARPWAVSTPGP
ncbi:MAG TPA: DUF6056 family protein [Anaeromyxobacter sp.]|nr:DUF6056 family protein [Anaeromyxobacter sp.]